MRLKILAALAALTVSTTAMAYYITGYFVKSHYTTVAGNYTQVCVYNVNGDKISVLYSPVEMCPMTKDFCF